MRNASHRTGLLAALVVLLGVSAIQAQPAAYTATATADRTTAALSDSVRVTLTIEGPAPLRGAVELPKPLLTADADGSWRIRPEGEVAVAALPNGRERWQRVFRLDPYAPGKPLRATFAPISVNGQPLKEAVAVEVTVERTGGDAAALPESLPVTTVEDLPPTVRPPAPGPGAAVAVSAGVALACATVFVLAWRRARRAKPVAPGTWARTALAKLEAEHLGGPGVAERVADILRRFVERRFAVPATKLTTSELYEALSVQGWPLDDARPLRELLAECDLAKFAGTAPDFEGCGRLIGAARAWLDRIDPAPSGG